MHQDVGVDASQQPDALAVHAVLAELEHMAAALPSAELLPQVARNGLDHRAVQGVGCKCCCM